MTATKNNCSYDKCELFKVEATSLCNSHYMRKWRGQDLDIPSVKKIRQAIIQGDKALIPLGLDAKDGYAVIDAEYAYLAEGSNWSLGKRGYPVTGNGITLHHSVIGKPEKGMTVDHIDRDPLNNRMYNLRFATYLENNLNRRINKNNTSGYKGVWRRKYKNGDKWQASIKVNYKKISLGVYDLPEEAATAYNEASLLYFGESGYQNNIKKVVK